GGRRSGRSTPTAPRRWRTCRDPGCHRVIIDCHGHYTTAPKAHTSWREAQQAAFGAGQEPPLYPQISDDEVRKSVAGSQLRLMTERGVDLTVLSPRASAVGHHF